MWCNMVWYGMPWCGVDHVDGVVLMMCWVWYGMVWCDLAGYTILYYTIQYNAGKNSSGRRQGGREGGEENNTKEFRV